MNALIAYLKKLYARVWDWLGDVRKNKDVVPALSARQQVLIIIPHDKSWWAVNAVQHFVATLRDQMGYGQAPQIDIVSIRSSAEVLAALLATIHNRESCDLIVTTGSWITQETRNHLDTLSNPPAHIFCGVIDPVGLGIVDSLDRPGRQVSGVATVQFDFGLQVDMLKALRPELKSLAILCGAVSGNTGISNLVARQIERFSTECKARHVKVVVIKLIKTTEIEPLIRAARDEHDIGVACVLNDLFISANLERLIAACEAVGVPLCTNELSSVYHGVAIGFGEHGGVYGMHAASLAYDLLVHNHSLAVTPVIVPPIQPSMRYNYDAMQAQGLILATNTKHLLSMVSVFFHSK